MGLVPEPATLRISQLPKEEGKKADFGAIVEGLDLNHISDADVQALKDAIWEHKVVVVKGQKDLLPIKQWELVTRFDPAAPQVHSHGDVKTVKKVGGILSRGGEILAIPSAPNVRVIGKGYQGADHHGLLEKTIARPLSHDWHATKVPDAEFRQQGHTRFQRWHLDAPLYERDPAWFTTLRCVRQPDQEGGSSSSPPLTVHWDDGSGQTMPARPGQTAFISHVQTYALLDPDEKALVDHSWAEYAPFPYLWMGDCRGRPNGLGVVSEGREKTPADLVAATGGDPWDPAKVKRYPLVWVNPVTGEKALMVHGMCVRRLFLRSRPDEEAPRVVDDVAEIRQWVYDLQVRTLRPEYIVLPDVEEGDVTMWANWQCFHTAIDYPDSFGPRTMHQANIGASSAPVGPVPIPAAG